jgi:hypothetical protein
MQPGPKEESMAHPRSCRAFGSAVHGKSARATTELERATQGATKDFLRYGSKHKAARVKLRKRAILEMFEKGRLPVSQSNKE